MLEDIRLFFVVDSIEDNEEIFELLADATRHYKTLSKVRTQDEIGSPNNPRIFIAMVRHAYEELEGWNYDDKSDTFERIKLVNPQTP